MPRAGTKKIPSEGRIQDERAALTIPRAEVIGRIRALHSLTENKANEVYEYRMQKGSVADLILILNHDAEEKGLPHRLMPREAPAAAATSLLAAAAAMAAAGVPAPEPAPPVEVPPEPQPRPAPPPPPPPPPPALTIGHVEVEVLEQVMWLIALRRGNGRKTSSGCCVCGDLRSVSGCPCRLGWEALRAAGRNMEDRL